jgi:hypothetical protein
MVLSLEIIELVVDGMPDLLQVIAAANKDQYPLIKS